MGPDKNRERVNLIRDNKKYFLNEVLGESQQETETFDIHCMKVGFRRDAHFLLSFMILRANPAWLSLISSGTRWKRAVYDFTTLEIVKNTMNI